MSAPTASESPANQPGAAGPGRWNWRVHLGWVASLFLIGVAAKLRLILTYGSPLPYLDEWPGDAIDLFIPYFTGHFSAATLFRAHNEHRIVFTQLCELGLLLANHQWDGELEMVLNAFIHSAAVAGLGWALAGMFGKRYWPLLWVMLAAMLVLPFAWENTLWGFQSQFYFLLIFSLLTIGWLGLSEAGSMRWRLGVVMAVTGLFTMASGFLAVDAVAALALLEILREGRKWRRYVPTLGVCAAVTVAGLLLKPHLPEHDQFQAHSAGEFLTSLGKNLAWPWPTKVWYAPFNVLPLLLLGWVYFRSPAPAPADRFILGIGGWVLLQSLAAAYARGAGGVTPAWRYMDLLSFLMLANGLSILRLLTHYGRQLRFPFFWKIIFSLWVLGGLGGLAFLTERALDVYIPDAARDQQMQLTNARAFLATDDPAMLANQKSEQLIVGNVDAVVWLLRHPVVRNILPACARAPLQVAPRAGRTGKFQLQGANLLQPDAPTEIYWGSFGNKSGNQGDFESEPIRRSALPYLEIPVAGDLGQPGLSLELVDAVSGEITPVNIAAGAGGKWVNAQVPAPAHAFKLVARDASTNGWFAFKEPREVGGLSYWAMRVMRGWKYFLAAGLICLAGNFFAARVKMGH